MNSIRPIGSPLIFGGGAAEPKGCIFKVAPSISADGTFDSESLEAVDNYLKLALFSTVASIDALMLKEGNALTWEKIVNTVEQDPLLVAREGGELTVSDSKTTSSGWTLGGNGSADPVLSLEIETWIHNKIGNKDLRDTVGSDRIKAVADLYAESGASLDSFAHLFANNADEEKTLFDVGILRFPDFTHPFLRLFRVLIRVTRHDQRVFFVQSDTSTITIDVHSKEYVPRAEIFEKMAKKTIEDAAAEVTKRFTQMFSLSP